MLLGGFIALILLFLSGMWLLSKLGPRAVSDTDLQRKAAINPIELAERRAEVTKLQAQFDVLSGDGVVTTEDLEVIQAAIRKQRELVKLVDYPDAGDLDLLVALEERYATQAGGVLHSASIEAEEASQVAASEGRRADAITAITRAIELQDKINTLYARGEYRDSTRLRRMQIQRENLEAEPLAQRATEMTQEARLLMTENPARAGQLLSEASALHQRLARDYSSSRFTSRPALREVEALLLDVEAAGLVCRRELKRKEAAGAVEEGRYEDGAAAIEAAIRIQQDLTKRFPGSSYARADELAVLEQDRQSALSTGLARSVEAKQATLRTLLRERKISAAGPLVSDLFREIKQLHDQYQSSRFLDQDRLLEARYLNLKRDDLGAIQNAVYERLRPVPGSTSRQMLAVEVSQLLYSLVMGRNPSSQKGDSLPVESVEYSSALEFCERLGWIMGFPVGLPSRSDFERALGEVDVNIVSETAWSAQNSERKIQPVGSRASNSAGFFDLLGNVSEWIDDLRPEDERQALVLGGSVRDSIESLERVPSAYVSRTERNRFTGFRMVMDVTSTMGRDAP